MIQYLSIGLILGLSAGLAPGPLLTLVVSETLKFGIAAGVKIALAPLVTDLPIIILTVFILSRLSGFDTILGAISLVGGSLVMVMGVSSIKTRGAVVDVSPEKSKSLMKGILVNVLSPHPYLFWLSVGAPTISRAYEKGLPAAMIFIASFYLLLVGAKVALALAVGKSRSVLKGRGYIYTMRVLGVMLCLLALFLFKDGLSLLGLVWMPVVG